MRTIAEALGLDPDEAVMRHMREPAADDAERARAEKGRRILLLVAAAALLVVALIFSVQLVARLLTPDPEAAQERPGLVYRRDAVRELADSGGEEAVGDSQAAEPHPPDAKR